jgi:hypothetical protein
MQLCAKVFEQTNFWPYLFSFEIFRLLNFEKNEYLDIRIKRFFEITRLAKSPGP